MSLEKRLEENYNKYVFPYEKAVNEALYLSKINITDAVDHSKIRNFTPTEYQEETLVAINSVRDVIIRKHRYSGYSTLLVLHLLYCLKSDIENGENNSYMVISPFNVNNKRLKDLLYSYFGQNSDERMLELLEKSNNIVFTTGDLFRTSFIGKKFKEVWIDEGAYVKNIEEIITQVKQYNPTTKLVTILEDNNYNVEKSIVAILSCFPNGSIPITQHFNWWEVPYFAKDLVWTKKLEVKHRTREECNKLIDEGWFPTSENYNKYRNAIENLWN